MRREVFEMHAGRTIHGYVHDFAGTRDSGAAQQKRSHLRPFLLLALLLLAGSLGDAVAQTPTAINVDVSMANQTFEGWGTSLAWFANSVGGWSNTANRDSLMQALFSQRNGLGLTYLRYNIGGGNDPYCGTGGTHYACISPSYHATPGYESSTGEYDWSQDANQRWVAKAAQSFGANLFEAVSYSPPYWMTISGTSEGGVGGSANLASGYFGTTPDSFADYLATVVQHFHTHFGITFHHVEPLNESGQTWWPAGDTKQEGCAFTFSGQEEMIQNMQAALASKHLLTQVAAMDEYEEGVLNASPKTTAYEFHNYDSVTQGDFTALNTHGYASTVGSVALATASLHSGKRLTVSEWGSGDTTGKDLSNQILADIYITRPTAWTIWQPDYPGLMNINYAGQSYTLNEAYYVFEQYTKFIRPGFQFIAIADPQSLAAFNQRTRTLVIVTQNWNSTARSVNFQLSNFTSLGSNASVYQTSATENFASLGNTPVSNGSLTYSVGANSVTTFVIRNASYTPAVTIVRASTTGTGINQFNHDDSWRYPGNQPSAYDHDHPWSSATNNIYTFQFNGQAARVYGSMSQDGGIVAFSVDDGPETYFDTYAPLREDDVALFTTPTLAQGLHTLKVRITGLKNPYSRGYNVPPDRIDVLAGGTETGQGIYKIVNAKNGLDLEVNGASLADGASVGTYQDISDAQNEHWNLMAVGDGSYRIVNVDSGLDLEVNGASKSDGGVVNQWQDSGAKATNEHWYVTPLGGGTYRIVNVNSGLDLELNGTSGAVDQWKDVPGSSNEQWTLSMTN